MQYLVANKEWIFSGIGVFVLASIWAILRHLANRRRIRTLPQPILRVPFDSDAESVALSKSASQQVSLPEPAVQSLTIDEVFRTVSDAPILQQPEVAKHFKGIKVRWSLKLFGAQKQSGRVVTIALVSDSHGVVLVEVDPAEYPGIGLLRKGDPVEVEGVIEHVGSCITLIDSVLSYHTCSLHSGSRSE